MFRVEHRDLHTLPLVSTVDVALGEAELLGAGKNVCDTLTTLGQS